MRTRTSKEMAEARRDKRAPSLAAMHFSDDLIQAGEAIAGAGRRLSLTEAGLALAADGARIAVDDDDEGLTGPGELERKDDVLLGARVRGIPASKGPTSSTKAQAPRRGGVLGKFGVKAPPGVRTHAVSRAIRGRRPRLAGVDVEAAKEAAELAEEEAQRAARIALTGTKARKRRPSVAVTGAGRLADDMEVLERFVAAGLDDPGVRTRGETSSPEASPARSPARHGDSTASPSPPRARVRRRSRVQMLNLRATAAAMDAALKHLDAKTEGERRLRQERKRAKRDARRQRHAARRARAKAVGELNDMDGLRRRVKEGKSGDDAVDEAGQSGATNASGGAGRAMVAADSRALKQSRSSTISGLRFPALSPVADR
mmetsp:Transcript_22425/g.63147  ORF Transcript_22425/g.63147 Transcript_22425/m.63147 type:complete len:373 (+) Transcript_22425:1-1119(+)